LPNVRDQRRRAVGAPLADLNLWEPLAILASGVPTRDDRCIALLGSETYWAGLSIGTASTGASNAMNSTQAAPLKQ